MSTSAGTNTSCTPRWRNTWAVCSADLLGARLCSLDFFTALFNLSMAVALFRALAMSLTAPVVTFTDPPISAPAANASIMALVKPSTSTSLPVPSAAAPSEIASCIASVIPSNAIPLLARCAIRMPIFLTTSSAILIPNALVNTLPALPGRRLSSAPIIAPPTNAAPGATAVGSFVLTACCVSPTPRMNEGMKAPKIAPMGTATGANGPASSPSAPPAVAPAIEGAMSGICSPPVCTIHVRKSPAFCILRNASFSPSPPA